MTLRSMSLVIDVIDLVTKHKSGELRCPATLIDFLTYFYPNICEILQLLAKLMSPTSENPLTSMYFHVQKKKYSASLCQLIFMLLVSCDR